MELIYPVQITFTDIFISFCQLAVAGLGLLGGAFLVMSASQRFTNKMRISYRLKFPKDMKETQVVDFIRSAMGELPGPRFMQPIHALVFETYADANGKRQYLHVPGHVSLKVDKLLSKKIAGIAIEPVTDEDSPFLFRDWDKAVELGMRGYDVPLRIPVPAQTAASIDVNFDALDEDEAVVMQWIVFRDEPRQPTPEDKDKVTDQTLFAVARVAAAGKDARRMVRDLCRSMRSVSSHGSLFTRRLALNPSQRINDRAAWLGNFRIYLNVTEFSALMGWPLDGGSGTHARHLAPDNMIDRQGIVVAGSDFPKTRGRPLAIPHSALMRHTWVLGPSGSGKSVVLQNMAAQAMQAGHGLILIEPKGDLARDVLHCVPKHRVKDVVWFDPTDTAFPIGLNVLAGHDVDLITSHIEGMFHNMFHDSWGDRLARILRMAVKTAAINGLTLYDCRHLLMNQDFRRKEVAKLKKKGEIDLVLEYVWLDKLADNAVDSVINKLDSFLGSRTMRNILGQHGGINMEQIVRERKILLVPLPSALIGQTNTSALGSLVREMLWDEIRRRPIDHREPILLMMDEFQNYADFNTSLSDPFAEARSYGLGLVIANQHTAQLKPAVLSSIRANTGSKIVFALESQDAKALKENFAPLSPEELTALPKFGAAVSLMSSSGKAPVTTAVTAPPPMPTGLAQAALTASRAVYGRPVADVEKEFAERHRTNDEERKRPPIGALP